MKIALIGYGKMGHMIEEIALQRGHEIVCKIDVNNPEDIDSPEFCSADVAIEFTNPTAAYGNYLKAFSHNVKVVSGSTGWMKDHKEDVEKLCADGKQTLFWASNFSIGAGNRYLADDNHWFKGEQSPYIQLGLEYGDLLGSDREYRPYDYFSCSLTANLAGNQPLIGSVNLKGCLLKKNFEVEDSVDVVVGLFQHFNYYDSEPVIDGTNHVPTYLPTRREAAVSSVWNSQLPLM